jgi:uncharacterized protein (DUF885 family)
MHPTSYNRRALLSLTISLALLSGCGQPQNTAANISAPQTVVTAPTESEKANILFEQIFMANVQRNPLLQTRLGIKDDYDKWPDLSDAHYDEGIALTQQHLTMLQALDINLLDEQSRVSYLLMQRKLEQTLDEAKWRLYSYPVNQMYGTHSEVPSVLINQHRISDEQDAKAYIARLNAVPTLFTQLQHQLQQRAQAGIIAPKFVFPLVISASENVIQGAPFDEGADSTLLADFSKKIAQLNIDESAKKLLINEARVALLSSVKPAYQALISYLTQLEQQAGTEDGVWRFKDGAAFYNAALKRTTTTDLTADEVHQIGVDEVARIQNEMRTIMKTTGFNGSLTEFFNFMQTDAQFYYADTADGKAQYLKDATAVIDDMRTRLDELFLVKPKAEMIVKAVEPFREKSAGKAFYEQPSMDGSRPGVYYANLYRMSDMPKYELEALAYHEGIPGHHMQLAIAQELESIPKFRRFSGYTAYNEGWGLYTELLPKEIGLYQNPYSDFGRLAMELWRACRLVVDTGIHAKKWNREQAISYLTSNTPNTQTAAEKAIERYIVMPSQATAYKIGMMKIIELREKAKTALGDNFDIRQFHDTVLKNGSVPLDVLEQLVDAYIRRQNQADRQS